MPAARQGQRSAPSTWLYYVKASASLMGRDSSQNSVAFGVGILTGKREALGALEILHVLILVVVTW